MAALVGDGFRLIALNALKDSILVVNTRLVSTIRLASRLTVTRSAHASVLKTIFPATILIAILTPVVAVLLAGSVAAQTGGGEGVVRPIPSLDQPIDADLYLIRPGERLKVTFIASKLSPFEYTVDAEGRVVDPKIGVHHLGDLTLAQARKRLLTPLKRLYNAEDIAISVTRVYPVTIRVTGAVRRPGRYMGYTSQTVSELIDSAGGVLPGGSTRYVRFSGGPDTLRVDLDRATFLADPVADPKLYAGHTIEVPPRAQGAVQIVGEVLTPREIEWVDGDELEDLVSLAGGPTVLADMAHAENLTDPARDVRQPGGIVPGDVIRVPRLGTNGTAPTLTVVGDVARPGRYELSGEVTMAGLISQAGGFTETANTERVTVFRQVPSGTLIGRGAGRYPIHVGDLTESSDTQLWAGDSVYVPTRVGFVEVAGLVLRPGLYPYRAGASAADYIRTAGGMIDLARRSEVELVDRVSGLSRVAGPEVEVADGDAIRVLKEEGLQ